MKEFYHNLLLNLEGEKGKKEFETGKSALASHQPVLDFHTGLLAKVAYADTWIVHDLDTLNEKGSLSIQMPTGNGTKTIPLYKKAENDKLFVTQVEYKGVVEAKLVDQLISLLKPSGYVNRPFLERLRARASELDDRFPPGGVIPAQRNTELLNYMLKDLGLKTPKFIYLSEILSYSRVKEILIKSLDQFNSNDFWSWEDNGNRAEVRNLNHAIQLLQNGRLIPKAVPISYLFHSMAEEVGVGVIGGVGQNNYESIAKAGGIDLPSVINRLTVTSRQGLRAEEIPTNGALPVQVLKEWSIPENYRPSALVMWLLGIQFDKTSIKVIDHNGSI